MDNRIRHEGIVEAVERGLVRVRIQQLTACADCKVASRCQAAEAKEKLIDVYTSGEESARWQVGQDVMVTASGATARKAVLLGFVLPLLLMLAVMAAVMALEGSEGMAALLMVASLLPYYILLWLCRHRIGRSIYFSIEDKAE